MKVIATATGIYPNGVRRRKGTRFDWDDKEWETLKKLGKSPSWVELDTGTDEAAAAQEKPAGDKPPKGSKTKPAGDKAPTGGAAALPGT
jgi:hypothetical protein